MQMYVKVILPEDSIMFHLEELKKKQFVRKCVCTTYIISIKIVVWVLRIRLKLLSDVC